MRRVDSQPRGRPRWGAVLPWLLLLWCGVLLPAAASAQQIGVISWGYDGRVVLGRFNLLVIEVHNTGNAVVDKRLRLTRSVAGASKGAAIEKRCYLSPGSRRLLTFFPFIESESETWTANWVEGGAPGKAAPGIRPSVPAQVILMRPVLADKRMLVPAFDPALLPANATAMDSLGAVLVDTVPPLNKLQRQALLDWVRGGGTLHRLLVNGGYPDLPDELAVLNREGVDFAFGSGRVHKCGFTRDLLRSQIPPSLQRGYAPRPAGGDSPVYAFRTYLRELVQSDHSWFVIFLVSVVYLVLVGPLFYKLSLQTLSWSAGLGILAVVVAAASFLFMGIGERGYLESDATHSLHYIQPLGGRMHDVTSYSNVFLTKGAEPVFQTDAGFGLFSSAQDLERVPAVITNGVHSGYRVDIPQFSHRLVIHKRQVSLDRPAFTRTAGEESISTGLEIEAMVEVEGKRLHWWVNRDGSWRRQRSFSLVMWQSASSNREEIGYRLLSTIMNSRLCVSLRDPGKPLAPPGQSDFYVLTAGAPNGLALESAPPTARSWTIYHFDLETPR